MHFTSQKMHSTIRASLAGILLARTRSKLANASRGVEFYTLQMVKEMHYQENTLCQGHTKCCLLPSTSCDLCTSKV